MAGWSTLTCTVSPDAEYAQPCHRCGTLLGTDPDDEPDGGVDGLPLCGECVRNRDEAADFEAMDMRDGELDGIIDW